MSARKLMVTAALSLCTLVGVALPATSALALSPGRAYERVSPLFSGGYGVKKILGAAPNGESVAYASLGIFAGQPSDSVVNPYQATRSSSGWSTAALAPAASVAANPGPPSGFSQSLDASLWELGLGQRNKLSGSNELQFAVHPAGAPSTLTGFEPVGPLLKSVDSNEIRNATFLVRGFSDNLCHVAVEPTGEPELPFKPLIETEPSLPPEAFTDASGQFIYEISSGCDGESPYARLVEMGAAGTLLLQGNECPAVGAGSSDSLFNAVSADGSEIFFADGPRSEVRGEGGCAAVDRQLFVRIGGVKTLEVSKPLNECPGGEIPCPSGATRPPAQFWGASEDGSRVFFTTTARLDSESDGGGDLYMATIGCPSEASGCQASQRIVTGLTQVSRDLQAGQAAEVQGVAGVATDGGRVYFVARGVLSEAPDSQGLTAAQGADNLYVYDAASGRTAFIAELCSGPEQSGAIADQACPSDLERSDTGPNGTGRNDSEMWSRPNPNHSPAQVAGEDGSFLVFTTYAQLASSGAEADTDDAQDVYRYDSQTGRLQRVSLGEAGYDSNGNSDDSGAGANIDGYAASSGDALIQPEVSGAGKQEERNDVTRAVSEDGSRIVFMTAAPLSPDATNGQVNVYEWHEGAVSMVSCGCATEGDSEAMMTPSGRDVFFVTTAELVPGNSNGLPVIYDARLGGGFPPAEAPVERCEGDACQGALSTLAPLLVPASAVQASGEDVSPPPAVTKHKAARKPSKHTRRRCGRKRKACARQPQGRRARR
jgi:hypothetical protein